MVQAPPAESEGVPIVQVTVVEPQAPRRRGEEGEVKTDILLSNDAVLDLMKEAVLKKFRDKLEGYNSPLEEIISDAFKVNSDTIRRAVYRATEECVNAPEFVGQLVGHLNHKLANLVINKCAGLVEKSFQELMQDAVLRNRLQTAVITIITEATK